MIKYEDGSKEVFEEQKASTIQTSRGGKEVITNPGGLYYRKYGLIMEGDVLLTPNEIFRKYENSPEALKNYTKARNLLKTGKIAGGVGLAVSLGVGLLKNPPMPTLAAAVAFTTSALIISITTTVSGRKKIRKSVDVYNSGLDK